MKAFVTLFFILLLFCNFVFAQNLQPVRILEKPSGVLKGKYGNVDVIGTVRVRVEFLDSGKVGQVSLVSGLPYGISESAVEAAKQIKFEPAKSNGVPITSHKVLEYAFNLDYKMDFVLAKIYKSDEKSEAIVQKAIQRLGGERYLNVKTVTGRGNLTAMKESESGVPSAFIDYIIYPDKERTEFKASGVKTIQTNFGDGGWIADGGARTIKDQTPEQIADFKNSLRTGLDNFLRGGWRQDKNAKLEYVGRREAGLGRRNEVVKLTYSDGLAVEFEFAQTDGTPAKSSFKRLNSGEEIKEEDRFAQFVEVGGVFVPYIIDHYRNGKQTSRVNYESIEFNTAVPDALFAKPKDAKKMK